MFTHENFNAYKQSIEFTKIALGLINELPSGHSAEEESVQVQLQDED